MAIQSTGPDLLRLCCCLVTERGISLCAPIHDAILVEDSLDVSSERLQEVREIMESASRTLLDGITIRTEGSDFPGPFRRQARGQDVGSDNGVDEGMPASYRNALSSTGRESQVYRVRQAWCTESDGRSVQRHKGA